MVDERLEVRGELIAEETEQDLAGALERVRSLLAGQAPRSGGQRIQGDHDHALRPELQRRLDRGVQPRAAVEVPTSRACGCSTWTEGKIAGIAAEAST